MQTTILGAIAAVALILYLARRRKRLATEE
jgi:LPXTG-motif cell wall-anchored protein